MNNTLESLFEEYKDTILKLRNVYFKIEEKLKKEEGFSQEDTETFLENKFKEIIRNANTNLNNSNNDPQQQEQQNQEQEHNTTANKDTTNKNNLPLYFQHFQ